MIKVGVIGHRGRMGAETCSAVESQDDLDLVARIGRGDDLAALAAAGADVAVDFTVPEAVADNVSFCLDHGIHAVVGTSGLSPEALGDLRTRAEASSANVFVAPNFALGAVLMMTFAVRAARYYDSVEIVERHHERKLDAPSGTSLRTAELMAAEHDGDFHRHGRTDPARGEERSGVHIHSLRLPGSVAHQEVIFGGVGEILTIRHDSLDRSSFMPGVLLAVRVVAGLDGLVVGLEHLLDV